MDEKELQLKELELKIKEKELELAGSDLSFREVKINQRLEETAMRQENLRRAVEAGSNCYFKFDNDDKCVKVREALRELVLAAAIKLKDAILN